MDIKGLVEDMVRGAAFAQVMGNPLAQFGRPQAPFLLADLLPERPVEVNEYTEEGIRYRTVIANASTRYSPVQIKGGIITGSMRVTLGNSDIGSHFTSADYDALLRLLERFSGVVQVQGVPRPRMEDMARNLLDWAEHTLQQPLQVHNELNRSMALFGAQVILTGDNGYREVVNLPNPTGARVAAGGTWTNNAYDPWADIVARANHLRNKGYPVGRIITSNEVLTILSNNDKVKARAGIISIASGTVTGLPGAVGRQRLNEMAQADGLPPFESYDRVYFTQNGYGHITPRDEMLFAGVTGRDQRIERGDLEPVVKGNTLGYTAIGRPAGQSASGRVVKVNAKPDSKPPRIEGEAWQSSFPVVTDPEASAVIQDIA